MRHANVSHVRKTTTLWGWRSLLCSVCCPKPGASARTASLMTPSTPSAMRVRHTPSLFIFIRPQLSSLSAFVASCCVQRPFTVSVDRLPSSPRSAVGHSAGHRDSTARESCSQTEADRGGLQGSTHTNTHSRAHKHTQMQMHSHTFTYIKRTHTHTPMHAHILMHLHTHIPASDSCGRLLCSICLIRTSGWGTNVCSCWEVLAWRTLLCLKTARDQARLQVWMS